jgi:hypothetical protein
MARRIHMQDQVGANKVEEIMHHDSIRWAIEQWAVKLAVIGLFLLIGVDWW